MTKDEILSLTPEQLRVEIAKRKGFVVGTGPMDSAAEKYGGCKWWTTPDGHRTSVIPDWPNDISAAWELAEEIVSLGGYFTVDFDTTRNVPDFSVARAWMCIMYTDPVKECLIAEDRTAPLAICRAWLMWKEGEG